MLESRPTLRRDLYYAALIAGVILSINQCQSYIGDWAEREFNRLEHRIENPAREGLKKPHYF